MESIVLIPGLIALVYCLRHGARETFINVYLPVLLILPEFYRWTMPGIPKVTFSQPVIMIVFLGLIPQIKKYWRWSWTDYCMIGMVITMAVSEYTNAGYKEAQNLTFDLLAWYLFPYIAGKIIIEPMGMRVRVLKRIIICLFFVSITSVYEFRFAMTPYRMLLDRFFPWQGTGWITTFRWGMARVAGPYGHAILAGCILVIGYRLHRWMEWHGHWEPRFKNLPWLRISKARIITYGLAAGIFMTMVRGPWIALFLATVVTAIGNSRNPRKAGLLVLSLVLLIGVPVGFAAYNYASVGRAAAKTVAQESAAYRKELIDKYVDIAIQKSWLGYGRNTWPKSLDMPSIDNYYLLLALMHGTIVVFFFASIIFGLVAALLRRAMAESHNAVRGKPSLAFTLAGLFVAIGFSVGTVYMGLQLVPVFAMLAGWSSAYIQQPVEAESDAPVLASPVVVGNFNFQRIVA